MRLVSALAVAGLLAVTPLSAEELSPEEEAARKAADPLGDVRALMTDNTIAFGAGESEDDTTFGFQLQPVYAIPNQTQFNMIARAVMPIIGVEPGVVVPPIGGEPRPDEDSKWGLSDTIVQYFFSPKSDGAVKWGIGPQVSLATHTSERTAGPGWGGGLAGVIFGGSGQWSIGAIVMQHWGDDFNIATLQPIAMYMLKSMPGAYIGYNNSMTYNWDAKDSSDAFTMPLGLTFGKTIVLASGDFVDLSIGAYPLAVRPDLAAEWQLKLGFSYFFN
jgi:hypothetical protein